MIFISCDKSNSAYDLAELKSYKNRGSIDYSCKNDNIIYYYQGKKIFKSELDKIILNLPEQDATENSTNPGDPIDCCVIYPLVPVEQNCNDPFIANYQEKGLEWTAMMKYQFVKIIVLKKSNNAVVQTGEIIKLVGNPITYCSQIYLSIISFNMGSLPCDVYKVVFEKGFVDFDDIRWVCDTEIVETVNYMP